MPRGKYVNHKGRSRHFTSPDELKEQENKDDSVDDGSGADSDDDETSDEEEEDRDARKGVASLIEIENPNRPAKKTTPKVGELKLDNEVNPEMSRREREQIEKQKAILRHAAGKTREAKADLARLALIRQQREEAAAKREAEKKAVEDKKASTSSKS